MFRITLLSSIFCALLSFCGTVSSGDDRRWLLPLVDLIELDYEDHCEQRATAAWEELIGSQGSLQKKLERDKAFGLFSRAQTQDLRASLSSNSLSRDDILKRRVKLLLEPGDTLLDTEQWIRLVTFGDTALHNLRFATDYDCGTGTNCTLRELQKSMTAQQDEQTLLRMKTSWERKLPSLSEYQQQILPLLINASKENNYNTVEEYWDSLGEYESGLLKARELWDQVKPLYLKLQKYVTLRLRGSDAVGEPLPVHLLRSLSGDDWSNVIESLLPKHPDVYQKLHANLQLKNIGSAESFKIAGNLLESLSFGPIESQIWIDSIFNGTCPTVIVDACKPNKVKVYSCNDITIAHYLDAHEAVMKIKYKEIAAVHSNNTYIIREANRFSAIYEAIPGFLSLLALTPHALDRVELYPLDKFNYRSNANHHRLVLQLVVALRDLPRLNYYLAADEWRLKLLKEKGSSSKTSSSWGEFRKNFSLLESADSDILGDPYVLLNKPFIGQFMGLILKYQIYQSFAEELMSDEADLLNHVSENNNRLIDTMSRGFGTSWPLMVSDLLAKRENGLEYTGLTDYFRLLDEYLDNQLEPSTDNIELEYEEPPEETIENEIPSSEIETVTDYDGTHENILENVIDVGDESLMKHSTETSTVGVLEIKNPVAANEDQKEATKEASYNTYWWIGIGVALVVIVILIAIIARKRQNHRKQLERQRENSQA